MNYNIQDGCKENNISLLEGIENYNSDDDSDYVPEPDPDSDSDLSDFDEDEFKKFSVHENPNKKKTVLFVRES